MNEKLHTLEVSSELNEALKRTRSLFWKQQIWEKSKGRKSKEVTLGSLSGRDQDALNQVLLHGTAMVTPEMIEFIEKTLKL